VCYELRFSVSAYRDAPCVTAPFWTVTVNSTRLLTDTYRDTDLALA
jgi:hypothetical protein